MRSIVLLPGLAFLLFSGCGGAAVPGSEASAPGAQASRAWERLRVHRDRNLLALPHEEQETLEGHSRLLGIPVQEGFLGRLAFVTALRNDRGEARWVLVWLAEALKVPWFSQVRVVVLGEGGRLFSDNTFRSGWRHVGFEGVERCMDEGWPQDLLGIHALHMIRGQALQYYARVGDRIELVRLEAKGEPLKNDYAAPNHTIGPVVPPQGEDECVGALKSGTWARRLSVLAWLAGAHWDGSNPQVWHEEKKEAERYWDLFSSPKVQSLILDLSKSSDPWTRQAAKLFY